MSHPPSTEPPDTWILRPLIWYVLNSALAFVTVLLQWDAGVILWVLALWPSLAGLWFRSRVPAPPIVP